MELIAIGVVVLLVIFGVAQYNANLRDIEFCLFDLLGREKVLGTSIYSELDRDTAMGMLEEMKRLTYTL